MNRFRFERQMTKVYAGFLAASTVARLVAQNDAPWWVAICGNIGALVVCCSWLGATKYES